jgi:ammonium transporter Rh
LLLIWTFFAEYDKGVLPQTEKAPTNSNVYACFQDVNVMIFIGFGYLMTYLKAQGQTAISFNWITSIWCIQWGILSYSFFHQLFAGGELTKIIISLDSLIWGLFAAATAMITYGALLGKCSLQ